MACYLFCAKPLPESMWFFLSIWPLGTNFSNIMNQNRTIIIYHIAFENVICKMPAILYGDSSHYGDHFILIHIQWNNHIGVIILLAVRSLQIFAHARTALLLWHVQSFAVIYSLEFRWEQNEISMDFELWWENCQWNGSQSSMCLQYVSWGSPPFWFLYSCRGLLQCYFFRVVVWSLI